MTNKNCWINSSSFNIYVHAWKSTSAYYVCGSLYTDTYIFPISGWIWIGSWIWRERRREWFAADLGGGSIRIHQQRCWAEQRREDGRWALSAATLSPSSPPLFQPAPARTLSELFRQTSSSLLPLPLPLVGLISRSPWTSSWLIPYQFLSTVPHLMRTGLLVWTPLIFCILAFAHAWSLYRWGWYITLYNHLND